MDGWMDEGRTFNETKIGSLMKSVFRKNTLKEDGKTQRITENLHQLG